jgi:hypothetical protein
MLLCMCPAVCCLQVKETTRAVTFLHNELFFAAAQKKYVYIYDKRGLEVHCLREHIEPAALEFLPHHFLLASVGEPGKPCGCSCCTSVLGTLQSNGPQLWARGVQWLVQQAAGRVMLAGCPVC